MVSAEPEQETTVTVSGATAQFERYAHSHSSQRQPHRGDGCVMDVMDV